MTKEMVIETKGFLYKLRWTGGGELPKELSGLYTSARDAEEAKESYLAQSKRKTKDGTSQS